MEILWWIFLLMALPFPTIMLVAIAYLAYDNFQKARKGNKKALESFLIGSIMVTFLVGMCGWIAVDGHMRRLQKAEAEATQQAQVENE